MDIQNVKNTPIEERRTITLNVRVTPSQFNFIKKNNLSSFDIYVLTAFPGTPVWEYAKGKGLVSEDMDWSRLNVDFEENHSRAIILSENLSGPEIYGFFLKFKRYRKIKEACDLIKKAFKSPLKALRFMIKRIGGLRGGG